MSYQSRRPSRARVPRQALGGLLDGLFDALNPFQGSVNEACMILAKQDPIVLGRQAQIDDLSNNWNPTGYYSPDQMAQALSFTMQLAGSVADQVRVAIGQSNLPSNVEMLQRATDTVQKAIGIGSLGTDPLGPYQQILSTARASGADLIHAPGWKRTVLNVMVAVRDATLLFVAAGCARPGWVDIFDRVVSAFNTLAGFLKTIGNLILEVGRQVASLPDTIGTMFTVLKWSALIGGLYFVGVKSGIVPPNYDPLKLRE